MASTYTSRFKLEKMDTGANANTWGTNTNNNLDVLDAFGGGYLAKSVAGSSNITLSTADADPTAESANKVIELTGALTGDIVVFIPAVESDYVFFNNTTGSQTLTIAATGHTANGLAITQGAYSHVYNDGSANFKIYNAVDKLGATTFKDTVTAGSSGQIILRTNGAVTATTFTGDGSNLTGVEPFASGTKMVFYQASAPTGWTQDTAAALSDAAFRVTTGSGAGTGGSDTFQTTFAASRNTEQKDLPVSGSVSVTGSVGSTTLSTPTIASHNHPFTIFNQSPQQPTVSGASLSSRAQQSVTGTTNNAGGGGGHSHPFSVPSASLSGATAPNAQFAMPGMNIKYANVIVAAKD